MASQSPREKKKKMQHAVVNPPIFMSASAYLTSNGGYMSPATTTATPATVTTTTTTTTTASATVPSAVDDVASPNSSLQSTNPPQQPIKPTVQHVYVPHKNQPITVQVDDPRGPRIVTSFNSYAYCVNWSTMTSAQRTATLSYVAVQNSLRMDKEYSVREDRREEGRRRTVECLEASCDCNSKM